MQVTGVLNRILLPLGITEVNSSIDYLKDVPPLSILRHEVYPSRHRIYQRGTFNHGKRWGPARWGSAMGDDEKWHHHLRNFHNMTTYDYFGHSGSVK